MKNHVSLPGAPIESSCHDPRTRQPSRFWPGGTLRVWTALVAVGLLLPAIRAVTLNAGDVLVADAGTAATTSGIIQVAAASGNRAFVTGNGVGSGAAIDTPASVTVSPAGTVYYLETLASGTANCIISVNPATGVRTKISGQGTGSGTAFASPFSIVWDPSTSTLLVSDAGTAATTSGIIRVDPATGNRTFVTGNGVGSGAAIDTPQWVACSSTGTIYYFETLASGTANCVISVVPGTGVRTKISGGGTGTGTAFASVWSLAWDPSTSTLLAADAGTSATTSGIIRIVPASGNRTFVTGNGAGSGAAIDTPKNAVCSSTGTIYYFETVASGTANCVISVDGTTGVRTKVSGAGTGTGTAFAAVNRGNDYNVLAVVPVPPPVISSTLTASGTYGSAISTYTITASNSPTSFNATGLPGGLSVNTATGAITGTPTATAGSPFNVTISATNASGTGSATLVFTINKKALTVSGVTASNKTYDGATTATLNVGSAALVGVVGGDTVTLATGSATGTFSSKTVANGKTVTVAGLTIGGASSANYTLTQPTTTANITAKALTISGVTASNKTYDGATTATLNVGSAALVGVVGGDTVTLASGSATGTFSDKTVANGKTVTAAGFTISGADSGNYSLTQPTTTANITAKALTISGVTASNKSYDKTTTATLGTGSAALVGGVGGDTVTLGSGSATGTFSDKNIGTGKTVTTAGFAISGTDSGNYSLTQPTTTANITAIALTVSGITASNKVYDTTTGATLNTGSAALVGVLGGETVTLSTGSATGTFSSKTVANGKTVTVAGLSIGGADVANYTLTQPTTTANITAVTLTVTGVTASNKTYDGATTATLGTGSAVLVGVLGGDTVTLNAGSATGTFSDKTVSTGKTVTVAGLALAGGDAGNYTLTQPTATADITAKILTVSGVTASNKTYDGSTTATLNTGGAALVGVVGGDTVTLSAGSATGAFATKTVANGKTVTISGISIGGGDSGNYSLTQPTTTANITALALTVTGVTAGNKVYDGATTATLNTGGAALVGVVGGDTVTLSTGSASGAFATKVIGTGKTVTVSGLALGGADGGNYTLTQPTTTADITAKALTVSGVTASNKVYDKTTTATLNTGSAALVGVVGGDAVTLDTSSVTGAFADKNIGTGKTVAVSGLALGGGDAGNYTLTSPAPTADITAVALTVTGITASDKVYNATTAATIATGGATLNGVLGGETVTLDTSGASGAFATKTVGAGKTVTIAGLTIGGADVANYTLTAPTTTASITAVTLTVTGVTASNKVYDATTAATLVTGSAVLVGVVGSDTVTLDASGATGTFADKLIGTGKAVTVSSLALGGADAANYLLTQPATTADITAKTLTVSGITASNKTYDRTTTATLSTGSAALVGVIGGDTVTLSTGSAIGTFSSKTVANGKTVTVAGLAISGADSGNYSLTQPTATANITAVTLTVTGVTASNKVYDAATTATLNTGGAALVGVIGGDTVTLSTGSAAGTFSSKTVANGKTVTVSGLALGGADGANYTLTQPTTTANITAVTLTVSGVTASNKVYDAGTTATLSTGSAALVGVVGGDTVTLSTGSASGAFADKNIGTGKTVTITGLALGGGDAGNYALTQPSTTANITAAALTVTGITASNKVYNGTTAATLSTGGAALVGVLGGDTVTLATGSASGTFSSKTVATAKTVTVSGLSISGTDSGNYSLTQPTTTANITALALTVTGVTATNRVYDGTTTVGLVTGSAALVGIVGGDTVTLNSLGATAVVPDKHIGTGRTVTVSNLSLNGADAGNYTLTQPTTTADITAKGLTVTGVTANNKAYDQTTAAALNTGSAALSGVVGGDTVTLSSGGASGAFADKNIGIGKIVSTSGFALGGADAGDYTLTQPAPTANITAVALTVSGITANNKVYDGTTAATLVGTGSAVLSAPLGAEIVTLNTGSASGAFASKTIGTGKTVTISGLTLGGADAGNYAITPPTTTADITAATLTVSGVTASDKTYDAATAATLNVASAVLNGIASGDTVTLNTGGASGAFASKAIGAGKTVTVSGLTTSGADAANYTLTPPTTTASITAKTLTVSGITASNKTYDRTTTATLGTGSAALVGVIGGDTVTLNTGSASGTFSSKTVANGKTVTVAGVSISGADSGNYSLTQPATTANITAAALTVTGVTASNRIYDGTTTVGLVTGSAVLVGIVGGDTVTLNSLGATAVVPDKNIGTGKTVTISNLSLNGADAANYTLTQPTATADITVKTLTVSGTTVSNKVYDATTAATPNFGSSALVGVVGGDTVTLDTSGGTAVFATKTVATAKAVTLSGLAIAGADAGNYSLTQPSATADITAKALTVSGTTASNKVYDATTVATPNFGSATLVGVVGGDAASLATGSATASFATKVIGTGKTVTVAGLTLTGADAANYALTQPATTADITAKPLTVSGATISNKVYDATTAATPSFGSATLVGVVGGDAVTLVTGGATVSFATKTVATAKPVTVSGLTLSGADAANYTLTQPAPTADITAKGLTVSGITASNKSYDGSTNATLNVGGAILNGVVGGDTVTLVTGAASGAFASPNAGASVTVNVSGLTLSGADATNYTLTSPTTTASISQGSASVTLGNLNQIYDGSPKAVSATPSPSGLSINVTYNGSSSAPTNAGSYAVSAAIADSNYSGSSSGTLTIAKAAQTIAFSAGGGAVNTPITLSASASSGLSVSFSLVSGNATLTGSSLTLLDGNAVVVRASQSGNDNYAAATPVDRTVVATAKLTQTIAFTAPSTRRVNDVPVTVTATASSGLPVSIVVASGPATFSGSTLTLTGAAGTVVLVASQAGNNLYAAAPNVTASIMVTRGGQLIFFGSTGNHDTIACDLADDGVHGTMIGYLTDTREGFIVNFQLNADGSFTSPASVFASSGNSPAVTSRTVTAAAITRTFQGRLVDGVITGTIVELNLSFNATAEPATGSSAAVSGFYSAASTNTATGNTYSMVGTQGEVFVLAVTPTIVAAGTGVVTPANTFSVQTAQTATIAGSIDQPTTTVTGTITMPGKPSEAFSGTNSTTTRNDRLINLSSRGRINPAAGGTLITGFVIGGNAPKRVLLRAVGPALAGFGLPDALNNPRLMLYDSAGVVVAQNDDWAATDGATFTQVGAFSLAPGSRDAALVITLAPGAYTLHVLDGGESGVALAEIYDASVNPQGEYQRLVNISTRGTVESGDGVLIGGFIISGNSPKRVLVRGIGPALTAFNVGGALPDPKLAVFSGPTMVARNDDWGTPVTAASGQVAASAADIAAAAQSVGAFALPAGAKDAAVIITLAPGAYTAQVSSATGATGVALVEIYELP